METNHDPREFIRQLQQVLISGNKKIGFFLGAGSSMIKEKPTSDGKSVMSLVPGIKEITKEVEKNITNKKKAKAIAAIKKEIESEGKIFHIENLLSKVVQKEQVVGAEKLCGLHRSEFKELQKDVETEIRKLVSIHKEKDLLKWINTHQKFAKWINEASRKNGVEIFTTNYDYLIEIAFEQSSYPYYDGFVGSFNPFFYSQSVENESLLSHWTKLWKIHGSLGWDIEESSKKIIKANKDGDKIIIFPSIEKYDNSKKQPYISYLDRLSKFIRNDDSVLFICGYSFGDDHINEIILSALSRTRTGCAISLLFDDFDEKSQIHSLAKNESSLSVYGKRNAIIGGKLGKWMLKSQPSLTDDIQVGQYFLQDAAVPRNPTGKGDEENPMTGDFLLVDFIKFVEFVSKNSFTNTL